jgi:signal transduction histidine kinase
VNRDTRWRGQYIAALLWLATTLALAGWWLVFGLSQAQRLQELGGDAAAQLGQVQRMLAWEGSFLLLLLMAGGVALLVAIKREQARSRQLQDFFSLFTHDLKTPLASLQLQAETLQEDLGPDAGGVALQRLMRDAMRLRLQLENALYYAQPDAGLFLERIQVHDALMRLADDFPDLALTCSGDAVIMADRRAFEGITRNVFQNAVVHGRATSMTATIDVEKAVVRIQLEDNGAGAPLKALRAIADATRRPAASSGTGLGLLISQRLLTRMKGSLSVASAPRGGVVVTLAMPEAA